MVIEFDRSKGVPKYLQLINEIKKLIQNGEWEAGTQVPTERELAERLNISRNTVSAAYKELEAEGILMSAQGRGTFVTDSDAVIKRESLKERLLKIVDMAIEDAAELGFNIDEFLVTATKRVMAKKEMLSKVKVVFIECNREQLDQFCKRLYLEHGVSIVPVLLQDLREKNAEMNELIAGTDLVLTTFFHLQEVKDILKLPGPEIIGIALEPQMDTIVRIARLPQGTKLGIVCLSDTFAVKIRSSLNRAGIDHLHMLVNTTKDSETLKLFIDHVDALVVSPNRFKEVIALNNQGKEVVEFRYFPDAGSVNVVKTALLELKRN
ncbi:GntR family transcriptional regulator [Phosphitispora sp. TUW77]|uniref:GntR family transcriptional regulator n=1 Tax=Phosphitispora sp. TUW77 TaxID=3152361 RepID=UPI003AB43816